VQIVEGQLAQYCVDGFHFLLPGSRSARLVYYSVARLVPPCLFEQASAQDFRQLFCNHLSAGDSDKSGDMVTLDGDIGRSNVVSKLILTGIA
jgi:hypothetical protein